MKFPVGVNEYHSIYFGYAIWIHCVLGIRSILKAEQKINCSFRNDLRTNSDRLLFPYVTKVLYVAFFLLFLYLWQWYNVRVMLVSVQLKAFFLKKTFLITEADCIDAH